MTHMKGKVKYLAAVASLSLAMLTGPPAQASSWDAVFYELTENMSLELVTLPDGTQVPVKRIGSGALMGTAKVGSPLCPDVLIQLLIQNGLIAKAGPCTVTANGNDTINFPSYAGDLGAKVAVTVELDNPVDAPEFVVMTGSITGTLQVIDPTLISMSGTWTPESLLGYPAGAFGLTDANFTGTVRLPFVKDQNGESRKPRHNERAFYLGDHGQSIRVREAETSLGRATARFELNFLD